MSLFADRPGDTWWNKRRRNISIVADTPGWYDPFAEDLAADIQAIYDDNVLLVRDSSDVMGEGLALFLSCTKLVPPDVLARNHLNVVVHASDLPKGRGFSPIVYQVLEGKNRIPLRLIEAIQEADSGDILAGNSFDLEGHELNDEIRCILGTRVNQLIIMWLDKLSPTLARAPQHGEPSWYPRRRPEDSRLDPEKTIAEQFDLLRVVDNERYPAFFDLRGHRYVLRITKA